MSCCIERYKEDKVSNEQKWDYINLSDFRSTGCGSPFSYGFLVFLAFISVAVYIVDLFTCANLLFFDRWSGQVKPVIPFEVSRWIFTACIMLSLILLAYRWWRAIRAMKTGIVAASYLDPLAVRVQSLRFSREGRGWRRFLVFAALTKGRKGAEYVALFTYFSFEAWLRICFAEGPRKIINALTLYSVMRAELVPAGEHAAPKNLSPFTQFFINIQILANKNQEQAAILFGMLFTLIIWAFSAFCLILAVIFYVTYLWHHIRDGSLSKYCRRKIDTRLHKIVAVKVDKALAKEHKVRTKQQEKDFKSGVLVAPPKCQPTLPLVDIDGSDNPLSCSRQTSQNNMTSYTQTSQGTSDNAPSSLNREPRLPSLISRNPTVPNIFKEDRLKQPSRNTTQESYFADGNYADNVPLLSSAAPTAFGGHGGFSGPDSLTGGIRRPPPARSMTDDYRIIYPSRNSSRPTNIPSRSNTDMNGQVKLPLYPQQPPVRRPLPRNAASLSSRSPQDLSGYRSAQEYEMHIRPQLSRMKNSGYVSFHPNSSNEF